MLDLTDSPASSEADNDWIRRLYPDLTALPRWATPRNLERKTLGPDLAALAESLGKPMMPWQRLVSDVGMELDADGKLHYRRVSLTIHRQAGKTTLILPWETHRGLAWRSRQRVVYTAQNRNAAREKFVNEQIPLLEGSVLGQFGSKRLSNGSESWHWINGSQIGLLSNTKRAGHGFTNNLAVIDEAFAQVDWRVEQALMPTMITVDEPQWLTLSTAGDETSVYLLEQVRTGRHLIDTRADERVAYFEWSIPFDADIDDPAVWELYMPAVNQTITVDALKTQRATMTDLDFRRAFGNQWTEGMSGLQSVIPGPDWRACADEKSKIPKNAQLAVLAIDVAPDQSTSSIAVAGKRKDGLYHVEAIDTRPGTNWLAERVTQILRRQPRFEDTVHLDPSTPAGALIPAFDKADVTVEAISGREWNQACASIYDAAIDHKIRHLDEADLNGAVASAGQTFRGDGWHWNRRGDQPITPLCAVTLAHWALVQLDAGDYDVLKSFL